LEQSAGEGRKKLDAGLALATDMARGVPRHKLLVEARRDAQVELIAEPAVAHHCT
jgi:hypothetical protein